MVAGEGSIDTDLPFPERLRFEFFREPSHTSDNGLTYRTRFGNRNVTSHHYPICGGHVDVIVTLYDNPLIDQTPTRSAYNV